MEMCTDVYAVITAWVMGALRTRDMGFDPWLSSTKVLNIGTLIATLPEAWSYRVSARTGWSSVFDWVK